MKPNSLLRGNTRRKHLLYWCLLFLCAIIACILVVSLNDRSAKTENAGSENPDILSSERGDEEEMDKLYERINFENAPSQKTPLNEENLNKIDSAIDGLDNRIIETSDALKSDLNVNQNENRSFSVETVKGNDLIAEHSILCEIGGVRGNSLPISGATAIESDTGHTTEYLTTDYIYYFDDSKYKLLDIYYDADKNYVSFNSTWITSSPARLSSAYPYHVLEVRPLDGSKVTRGCHISYKKHFANNELVSDKILEDRLHNVRSLLRDYDRGIKLFSIPEFFTKQPLCNVFTDGNNFFADFNADNFKNKGGTVYYVATTDAGANILNTGKEKTLPIRFQEAYSKAVDGDTIVFLEGDYHRNNFAWNDTVIQKSINIIGEGKVRFIGGDARKYTKTEGYESVYQMNRSLAVSVVDYGTLPGKYIPYTKVASVDLCEATKGSYFINGSVVYVHALDSSDPTDKVVVSVNYDTYLHVNNSNGDVNVYIENIELVAPPKAVLIQKTNTENELKVCLNNVRSYYSGGNAFSLYGGEVILNNCKGCFAVNDGFNYNGTNGSVNVDNNYMEIDCLGANNGFNATGETQNGSTSHAGSNVVRVNGTYYNNYGPNCADVQANTKTLSLGCIAFDSAAPNRDYNFEGESEAQMYCHGCISFGSTKDFISAGAIIDLVNCTYTNNAIDGTHSDTNPVPIEHLYNLLLGRIK